MAEKAPKSKLEEALSALDKQYGKGTVIKGNQKLSDLDTISTGSITLDYATGIGGLPRGRIVELIGPESSGKTTLALHTTANAQKIGKVAYIDMEHALDGKYAAKLGVDMDNLLISQPSTGEEALTIAKNLMATGEIVMVVIDSIAALVPQTEAEGDVGDPGMAKQARMLSQAMRILSPIAGDNNCLLLLLNQFRKNIGGYGNPEISAGGEAIKYYASVRIDIRKKNEKDDHRNDTTCKLIKNKVGSPFTEGNFYIEWGKGISKAHEIINLAVENGLIGKGGAWYNIGEDKFQGEDKLVDYLRQHTDVYENIKVEVLKKLSEND